MFAEKGWMTATTFTKWLVEVGTQILLNCLFNTFAYISMTLLQVLLHLFFVLRVHTVCGQTVFAWPKGHPVIRWHSSHENLDAIEVASKEGIELYVFPPT